jgi:hypothetical protein
MPKEFFLIAIVAIIAGSLSGVFKMWLKRPIRGALPQGDLKEIRDGLARMEQSIDAIAIEVERLSEGQRFTTRLLSEGARSIPEPAQP